MERLDGRSKPVSPASRQASMGDAEPKPPEDRLAQLKAEISNRLRRLCSHLTVEQFDELVRDIADVTLRYEHPAHFPAPRRLKRDD